MTKDHDALAARVAELEHDLAELAALAGKIFGQPFASQAAEILAKRQTAPAVAMATSERAEAQAP